jgi:hypothetical protein
LGFRNGLITAVLIVASAAPLPRMLFGRDAIRLWEREPESEDALARGLVRTLDRGVGAGSFATGSERFDGEWTVVTLQMTALALGQLILERPVRRSEYLPAIERSVAGLQTPAATRFGATAWGRGGFDDLESARGHAYLGYSNLAFGMLRLLDPRAAIGPLHDRVTAALARRLEQASHALIETYPGEAYPADVAAVAASIALYDRATGANHRALLDAWTRRFAQRYVDSSSGLLYQSADAESGAALGPARASGTAIAVYFLAFFAPELAERLTGALIRQRASLFGFGAIREYPDQIFAFGDVDSGPLFFGASPAASAFALAGVRSFGSRDLFCELMRTAELVGVPVEQAGRRSFVTGGPLGNAIVLAMVTSRAVRAEASRKAEQ